MMNLEKNSYSSLIKSDYEFNRFDKKLLESDVSLDLYTMFSSPYSGWETFSKFLDDFYQEYKENMYCYVTSNVWLKETKLNLYGGIERFFVKKMDASFDFIFQGVKSQNNHIIHYGLTKLDQNNFIDIVSLISKYENGFLFISKDDNFSEVNLNDFSLCVLKKECDDHAILDMVKVINNSHSFTNTIIYPYEWSETGSYHLGKITY